jgi:hypothetical protein
VCLLSDAAAGSGFRCDKGHALVRQGGFPYGASSGGWSCDKCKCSISKDTVGVLHCAACKYDVCLKCSGSSVVASAASFKVGDRVRLKPSIGKPRWDWPDTQPRDAVGTIARFDDDGDPRLKFASGPDDWAMHKDEIELASSGAAAAVVGDLPPQCAAVRPKQVGDNTCKSCQGKYKDCFGSYGTRLNGTWTSGPSTNLDALPESPNKDYCCQACQDRGPRSAAAAGGGALLNVMEYTFARLWRSLC